MRSIFDRACDQLREIGPPLGVAFDILFLFDAYAFLLPVAGTADYFEATE